MSTKTQPTDDAPTPTSKITPDDEDLRRIVDDARVYHNVARDADVDILDASRSTKSSRSSAKRVTSRRVKRATAKTATQNRT